MTPPTDYIVIVIVTGDRHEDYPTTEWMAEFCPSCTGWLPRLFAKSPSYFYRISDAHEAMLFKLTWGGK